MFLGLGWQPRQVVVGGGLHPGHAPRNGGPVSTLPDLDDGLRQLGFESFRPGQREAIQTLLCESRALLVAPTGGGKSLTYQLPALLLPGTTLVVSPLIALMQDQVAALSARGVSATYLASTLGAGDIASRMDGIRRGAYRIVYAAPERLAARSFRAVVEAMRCPLLAIDEAHCISEWGHDFRPEYLAIGDLVRALPSARVLACTATATPVVRDEIVARLGLGPDTPQIVRGFSRNNLILRAREVQSARDRHSHVDAVLREALGPPETPSGAAIVYSPTRTQAEREALRLAGSGWRARAYHAGLDASDRSDVQDRFFSRKLDVVVATNAFGMGIDRSDVRAVVHLSPPSSVEAYYQEVGRAGRDGAPALGLLLSSRQDLPLRRRLIEGGGSPLPVPPEIVEHKWGLFLDLMRWAEGGSCRHDAILRYFGAHDETSPDGCGRCDVCTELVEAEAQPSDTQQIVQKALSGVARAHGRFGLTAVVKLLTGSRDPRLERAGLLNIRTFGTLAGRSEDWVLSVLRRCVTAGWVSFSASERPVVLLTEEGRRVMMGQHEARLVLPRSAATSETRPSKRSVRREEPEELDATGQALFEELRQHRLEIARREGVPPYVIASDRTLKDIARLRPTTAEALLTAHGVGKAKAERYGEAWIEVVRRRAPAAHAPSG
jgi:ATP-dependent DNA helicase RecQ